MKYTLLLISVFMISACSNSDSTSSRPNNPRGLGPDGGQQTQQPTVKANQTDEEKLKPVLEMGQRAVKWLNLVNAKRDLQSRLNLADRSSKNPVPPEKPKVVSTDLILAKFSERISQMPAEMKPYLLEQKDLVEAPPVADELFIKSIRDLNGSYQNAIRWMGQIPYIDYYSENDVYDIRGIYFFKKEIDLENKLSHFTDLDEATKLNYKNWLVGMCHNSTQSKANCLAEIEASLADVKDQTPALDLYKNYLPTAQKTYDGFFKVEKIRQDLKWNTERSVITQDFTNTQNEKVANWFKTNVEEEWQLEGFHLLIQFVEKTEISPFLEFVKGVTPHVSGETFNKITMDPDYSLDDYDTQWTIRHEFGHVLGFPDCYLEFFDPDKKEMNYYTIEPDNLMCAWGGKLQPSHAAELKRAY